MWYHVISGVSRLDLLVDCYWHGFRSVSTSTSQSVLVAALKLGCGLSAIASAASLGACLYFLPSLLTSLVLLDEPTVTFLVRQFCAFCVARRFFTIFAITSVVPCPKPGTFSSQNVIYFPYLHFDIILPFATISPKLSSLQGCRLSLRSFVFLMRATCTAHLRFLFDHSNVYWRAQNMTHLIVHFSAVSCRSY